MSEPTAAKLAYKTIVEHYAVALVKWVFPCPIKDCPVVVKGALLALLAHLAAHGLTLEEIGTQAAIVTKPMLPDLIQKREDTKRRFVKKQEVVIEPYEAPRLNKRKTKRYYKKNKTNDAKARAK